MSAKETMDEVYQAEILALRDEVKRLNGELRKVKDIAFKLQLSASNLDKPLSEIETDFEIVNPN